MTQPQEEHKERPPSMKDVWERTQNTPTPEETKPKVKRWGLFDVLMGFILMIVTQIGIGIVLVVIVTAEAAQKGIYDTAQIADMTIDTAMSPPILIASSFLMYISWLIPMFWASFIKGAKSFAKDYWIYFKWTDILWGLGLGLGLRLLDRGLAWFLIDVVGIDIAGADNTSPIVSQTGFAYFMLAIVIGCISAPLFEEMFLRGMMLQGLLRYFRKNNQKPTTAIGKFVYEDVPGLWKFHKGVKHGLFKARYFLTLMITGGIFGFMHFQGTGEWTDWLIVAQTGLIGVFFAWIVLKTKRVGTAIAGHAVFNITGIILATIAINM